MTTLKGTKTGSTITLNDKDKNKIGDGEVEVKTVMPSESSNPWTYYRIITTIITGLAIVYLVLIPFGIYKGKKPFFELTELGIFASILLLNSDRLSKIQFGKEGFTLEVAEEIKSKTETLEKNQKDIQECQATQYQKIEEIQESFHKFLSNNDSLFENLKTLENVQLPSDTDSLIKSISDRVGLEVANQIQDNSGKIYSFIGAEITKNLPEISKTIANELQNKVSGSIATELMGKLFYGASKDESPRSE